MPLPFDPSRARAIAETALGAARAAGASYADVRAIGQETESVAVKNEEISELGRNHDFGFGVRVIADGAWGFASCSRLSESEGPRIASEAVAIARASASCRAAPVVLAPEHAHRAVWRTPFEQDPFSVPVSEKLDLLFRISRALRRRKEIRVAHAEIQLKRKRQIFVSSEGADIDQYLLRTGAGYVAMATDDQDMQARSFPASHGGQWMCRGWELVGELRLLENCERVADEATALLAAPVCPAGKRDLILDGSQIALQIHESCGHPTELDRVLGTEANYAGTSFLTPEKLGRFAYGSRHVTITADSTIPGGLATVAFDDEGVTAQHWPLVLAGTFAGYLTSRETAASIGEPRSRGAMRADGWSRLPIIRMPNISLEPETGTLDDLIADTRDGIYMETNRSWSIDQRRIEFQFGTEIAWEVKDGRRGRILKRPVYRGKTPEFWGACDAVCGPGAWRLWGVGNCGKGEPPQTAEMSHGAAPARFRGVEIGGASDD